MKRLIKNVFILLLPLLLISLTVAIVDPYQVVGWGDPVGEEIREKNSAEKERILFSLSKYYQTPEKIIITGDSRTDDIDVEVIRERFDLDVADIAYPGADFWESVEYCQYLLAEEQLEAIYFFVPFDWMKETGASTSRFQSSLQLYQSIPLYLINPQVISSTFGCVKDSLFPKRETQGKEWVYRPILSTPELAEHFELMKYRHFDGYHYSQEKKQALSDLAAQSREKNVQFFIFNTVQNQLMYDAMQNEFGLGAEYERYLKDMELIADQFFNVNTPEARANEEWFSDSVHVKDDYESQLLIAYLFGEEEDLSFAEQN